MYNFTISHFFLIVGAWHDQVRYDALPYLQVLGGVFKDKGATMSEFRGRFTSIFFYFVYWIFFLFFFLCDRLLNFFFLFSAMYITVMSQEPDALAFIDLILTGFIKANTTTGQ